MVAPTVHPTEHNFVIGQFQNQKQISLGETFSSISQPISTLSQCDSNHRHFLHIHIQQASYISSMNHWAHAIQATLQQAKVYTNSVTLCLWESFKHLNQFQCILIFSPKFEKKKFGNQKVKSSGLLMSFLTHN